MASKVKWGVVGSGGIARRRTIPEGIMAAGNAELVAAFDVDECVNTAVASETGAVAAGSLEALLAMELDVVYIATPANLHFVQAKQAAAAGKHVFCEKPLGMTVGESEGMVEACRKAGVKLGTAFMMRFHAQHQAAKELIEAGRLGKPVYARAQLSCWYPPMPGAWRQDPRLGGGGSLIDMGGHCIDLLEMLFGEVVSVQCMVRHSVHEYPSEDNAVALLAFANGALGTVDASFCIPDASSKNRLELYGSQGSILAQGTIGQGQIGEMIAFLEHPGKGYDAQQARAAEEGLWIRPEPRNMYLAEIEEFGAAILEDRAPVNSAEPGVRSQKILAACYASAGTGQAMQV